MYSGNHAFVHPLDTLLEAAVEMQHNPRVHFAFVGGVRVADVSRAKNNHRLLSLSQHPFQPRDTFSCLNRCVRFTGCGTRNRTGRFHYPNKIYGAMLLRKPILYLGPAESHIGDILRDCPGNISVEHGQVDRLVKAINAFESLSAKDRSLIGENNRNYVLTKFPREELIRKHMDLFE